MQHFPHSSSDGSSQQGRKLKKVQDREDELPPPAPDSAGTSDMAAVLQQRLNAMHKVMRHNSDDEDEDEDDGWSSDD